MLCFGYFILSGKLSRITISPAPLLKRYGVKHRHPVYMFMYVDILSEYSGNWEVFIRWHKRSVNQPRPSVCPSVPLGWGDVCRVRSDVILCDALYRQQLYMRVHNELENVAKTPLKKTLKTPVKKPTVKTLKKRNKNVKKPKLIKVASVSLWRPVVLRVCRPTRLPSYASAILRACRPTRLPSYASAVLRVCRLTRPPSYAGRRRIDYSSVSALSGNFPVSPPPHRPPAAALSLRAMNPTRRVESFESALMSVESDPVASGGGAMPICGR